MCCTNPDNVHCFGTIFPNLNFVFASICAARPVHIQSDQYRSCSTVKQRHAVGAAPKTALLLWIRETTWYLYTRGVRGRLKAKQRWFKVTREPCHEWFHHVRHHVHDGHWTAEFATVIWCLHCFPVSFRGDVRGDTGPKQTRLSQLENTAMGTWPSYKNYYTRLVRQMVWYQILIHVLIV